MNPFCVFCSFLFAVYCRYLPTVAARLQYDLSTTQSQPNITSEPYSAPTVNSVFPISNSATPDTHDARHTTTHTRTWYTTTTVRPMTIKTEQGNISNSSDSNSEMPTPMEVTSDKSHAHTSKQRMDATKRKRKHRSVGNRKQSRNQLFNAETLPGITDMYTIDPLLVRLFDIDNNGLDVHEVQQAERFRQERKEIDVHSDIIPVISADQAAYDSNSSNKIRVSHENVQQLNTYMVAQEAGLSILFQRVNYLLASNVIQQTITFNGTLKNIQIGKLY